MGGFGYGGQVLDVDEDCERELSGVYCGHNHEVPLLVGQLVVIEVFKRVNDFCALGL